MGLKKKKQSQLKETTTLPSDSIVEGILGKVSQKLKKPIDDIRDDFMQFQKDAVDEGSVPASISQKSWATLYATTRKVKIESQIPSRVKVVSVQEFNDICTQNGPWGDDDRAPRVTLRAWLVLHRREQTKGDESGENRNECWHGVIMDDTGGIDFYAYGQKAVDYWSDYVKKQKPQVGDQLQITGRPWLRGKAYVLQTDSFSAPTKIETQKTMTSAKTHPVSDLKDFSWVHVKGIGIAKHVSDGYGCQNCNAVFNQNKGERQRCQRCRITDTPHKVTQVKFTLALETGDDVICENTFPKDAKVHKRTTKRLQGNTIHVFGQKYRSGEIRVSGWKALAKKSKKKKAGASGKK